MLPDARFLDEFLKRARRRLVVRSVLPGAAIGMFLVTVLNFTDLSGVAIGLAVISLSIGVTVALGDQRRWRWWSPLAKVARCVERRTSVAQNLLVTAAELPPDATGYVSDAVITRAAAIARSIDLAELFPVRRAFVLMITAAALMVSTRMSPPDEAVIGGHRFDREEPVRVRALSVTITPPAYSGLPVQTLENPTAVEALAGSVLEVSVDANALTVRLETLTGVQDLRFSDGRFRGHVTASTDGFIAVEPRDSTQSPGARQLVGLSVREDRPPRVTLTAPGRDLFFSAVPGAIDVAITADDDLALDSLVLRYTAVSGSGERFTFVERTVPMTLNASSPRSWMARGRWALDPLALEPGDLVVYRAVARDRRPGAPAVESESYVIEVVTPGAIASEGFAADDQRDRYAASQQMVILKTERLIARRAAMPADSISDEARLLAAEQRQVRAEFVFMMGGEVDDHAEEAEGTLELNEVAEAEAEGDILAGRLANQGRIEVMRAIRAMSRASSALIDADLDRALRDERAALDNLMRAFSRSRFILRALTQRERIDLQRRLSGSLASATGLSQPQNEAAIAPRTAALRAFVAALASLAAADSGVIRARVSDAAMAVVRADPGSDELRRLAARAQGLAQARGRVGSGAVDSLLHEAVAVVTAAVPLAPNVRSAMTTDAIAGQLRDARRRAGGRP